MAARIRRTIDPSKVTDLSKWLYYYKGKYTNLLLGKNNTFLVCDPSKMDNIEDAIASATIIKPAIGYDCVTVLQDNSSSAELRALAQLHHDEYITKHVSALEALHTTKYDIEQQLLKATDRWNQSLSSSERKDSAYEVAQLTLRMQELEKSIRNTIFPHRYRHSEYNLQRNMIRYETHDERVVPLLNRLVNVSMNAPDRTFTVTDTA